MTHDEIIDQMQINTEIGILSDLKEYLSYSSDNPERHFVKTDNTFTRKARLLQAIRRWQSGAECGSFVRKGITYYHPNLAVGGEQSGCNFLHPVIFNYAKFRVNNKKPYETIEEERLFNNFLSSQPMAFNLFVPLMEIIKCEEGEKRLAAAVTRLLDPNRVLGIDRIYEVGVEFIPDYYKECLNDKTAMDAYLRYSRPDGQRGIIAIETKYTDMLGTNQASDPSLAIKMATEVDSIAGLFTDEGKLGLKSGNIVLSQVYRNFLLTETVRLHEHLSNSLSIVLAPKENVSNLADEKQLEHILKEEFCYKFQAVTLETFVDSIINEFPDEDIFRRFKHRYLDFRPAEWLLQYPSH